MNEWAYIKLYNLQVSFCDFINFSYSFWPLNQNRLVILWYQLLLYSETQVSDVICVFFFRFITSTAQVNKTPYQTRIRTPGKLPLYALVTVECSLSLRRHPPPPLGCLMHMVHLSGNTSGVLKSSSDWLNYTGFPGDVCLAFFNVSPENKDAVEPNPSRKKKAVVFTNVTVNAYQS